MNRSLKQILAIGLSVILLNVGCAGKKGKGGGGGDGPGPGAGGGGGGEGGGKQGRNNRAANPIQDFNDSELARITDERNELQKKLDEVLSFQNNGNQNGFTGNGINQNQFSVPSPLGLPPAGAVGPGGTLPDNSSFAVNSPATGELSENGGLNVVQVGSLPGGDTASAPAVPGVALQSSASRVPAGAVNRDLASHAL